MSEVLLDSQAWLWLRTEPERINRTAMSILEDPEVGVLLSLASCWELAIKFGLGKLALPAHPASFFRMAMAESGVEILPITLEDVVLVPDLPLHHGDPFDRLIIAQALRRDLRVVTSDRRFKAYGVRLLAP